MTSDPTNKSFRWKGTINRCIWFLDTLYDQVDPITINNVILPSLTEIAPNSKEYEKGL